MNRDEAPPAGLLAPPDFGPGRGEEVPLGRVVLDPRLSARAEIDEAPVEPDPGGAVGPEGPRLEAASTPGPAVVTDPPRFDEEHLAEPLPSDRHEGEARERCRGVALFRRSRPAPEGSR